MRQLRHIILLLCLSTLCPKAVMAQIIPRDIPTIEDYINDHKKQRSLLLARATLEESNALLCTKPARSLIGSTGTSILN